MKTTYKFTLVNTNSSLNLNNISNEIDESLDYIVVGKNRNPAAFTDVINLSVLNLQRNYLEVEADTLSNDTTWRRWFGEFLKEKVAAIYLDPNDDSSLFEIS